MKYQIENKFTAGSFFDQRFNAEIGDAIENALAYVLRDVPANTVDRLYVFPCVVRGNSRMNMKNGTLSAVFYTSKQVVSALNKFNIEREASPALAIKSNVVKLSRFEFMAIRNTFGKPVFSMVIDDTMTDYKNAKARFNRAGLEWELSTVNGLKNNPNAKNVFHVGSLNHGKSKTDLLQTCDIVLTTDLPIELW